MNPRLAKELRVLLLPGCLALVIAIVILLANFFVALHFLEGEFLNFVLAVVSFTFFGVLLAISALPFGSEFQHQTFPLLLSQAIPRSKLWRDKLIAALIGIAAPLLVLALGHWVSRIAALQIHGSEVSGLNWPWEMALFCCALLLPTLGSVGYWTLLARSTLGGMVFTAFAQLIVFGLLLFVAQQFDTSHIAEPTFFAVAGAIYGAIFFMLSWRRFARLELSHLSPDASASAKSLTAAGLRLQWLRCGRANGFLNLIRKEIQLQKPLFIIAAILCILWMLTYVLLILQPYRTTFPEIIFALTMGAYIPLIALLAGCVSLGEEKNLGLTAWQLTLPISIRRQWAVKLGVGFGTWLLLGLVLPFILTRLGLALSRARQMEFESWLVIALLATSLFALSFWAMTLFSNTVRAVIGSLAIFGALCSSAALAYCLVLLVDIAPLEPSWRIAGAWSILGILTVFLALFQSLIQYRRLQTSWIVVAKYSSALVIFTFFETVCYLLFGPLP